MSENNDTSNESNSLGSDSNLQASRLSANPVLRSGVLRPSLLGQSVLSSTIGTNRDVQLAATENVKAAVSGEEASAEVAVNPFMREQKDDEKGRDEEAGAIGVNVDEKIKNAEAEDIKKPEEDEEPDERPDPLTLLRKNGLERANMFAAAKSSIPRVERSGFVFGQNVHERVIGENINSASTTNQEDADGSVLSGGGLLFSSVIQNAAKTVESDVATASAGKDAEAKTLTDVAREYEESRAQKRKYDEVETFTGEENELNIVDVNCKLFAFINSNWEERGRGSLRLNNSKNDQECSRVVFRTSGNLRLLLNTKVWAGMVAERPSQKSLRLTAMDNTGKINVYLAMARPVDINLLHKALVERIELRKVLHPEECRASVTANNGDEVKNGAALVASIDHDDDEVDQAASVVESANEKSAEPSQKKST